MKRFLFSLALMALLPAMAFAEHVEPTRAQKVAKTFLSNNDVRSAQLTDVAPAAGFTNLYIFNAHPGFVVMAADDRVQPILGYSLTGTFVTDDMPDNVRGWLQGYDDEIHAAIDHRMSASSETAQKWHDLETGVRAPRAVTVVDPLIKTQWGQGSPYNNYCPSGCVTGCVATAMAQVMKYWNYPSRGIGSHDYQYGSYGHISADFGATTYDWANMTNSYSSSSTEIQRQAVAKLMSHCGVSVEMQYGPESGSNILRSSISMGLYFNYSANYIEKSKYPNESDWVTTLKQELNASRPILYAGSGTGGHAFVCDGYDSSDMFHFNWGWNGGSNGYFALSSLTPGNFNFSYDQNAVINIQPLTGNSIPLSLTAINNEGTISLSWIDGQSSDSYHIYRNNALIATATGTSFVDAQPLYGPNVYYVRGMKDDILSLPSNAETITIDYPTPVVSNLNVETSDHDVTLSWDDATWSYPPQADATTFSYVDEERLSLDSYYYWGDGDFSLSWGHRYPSESLTSYNGKAVFEVSFFSMYSGTFDVVVYQGTNNDKPLEEVARESITTARYGWSRVGFNNPAIIDSSKDLWVFVINTDFKVHKVHHKTIETGNTNACYFMTGVEPTVACSNIGTNNVAWMICTYLTDGTYTYNLYRDGTALANDMSDTQYTDSNLPDGTYSYYVTTNYYGGVTEPSNTVTVTVPGTFTQTVELNEGWTWWTPTVTTSLTDLESALRANGILINSQDGGFVRYENDTWSGTLQGFVPGQMYKINVQTVTTITLTGTPVAASTISILPGYNWFGYTGEAGLSIDKALGEDFTPNVDDQIIGQDGTAQYGANGWSGTLGSLVPGKGYIYQSTATRTKPITF